MLGKSTDSAHAVSEERGVGLGSAENTGDQMKATPPYVCASAQSGAFCCMLVCLICNCGYT